MTVEMQNARCSPSPFFAQPPLARSQITLVCLGPLTTIALACRLDATLPSKVKEMVWMGGTIHAKGNVSLTAEFNVHKVLSGCFVFGALCLTMSVC